MNLEKIESQPGSQQSAQQPACHAKHQSHQDNNHQGKKCSRIAKPGNKHRKCHCINHSHQENQHQPPPGWQIHLASQPRWFICTEIGLLHPIPLPADPSFVQSGTAPFDLPSRLESELDFTKYSPIPSPVSRHYLGEWEWGAREEHH